MREYRRGLGSGMTGLNSISPLKKSFSNNQVETVLLSPAHSTGSTIAHYICCETVLQVPSQKFPRNTSGFNHKGWLEDGMSRGDSVYPFQVRMSQVNDQGVACYDALSKEVKICLQSLTNA